MEYIKIDGNKVDLMRTMVQFTSSGKLVDSTLKFIEDNKQILSKDEMVDIVVPSNDLLIPGVEFPMNSRRRKQGVILQNHSFSNGQPINIANPYKLGPVNWVPQDAKYHINLKKTTLLIILFLFDLTVSKGVANFVAGVLGITTTTINSLNDQERCLVLDVIVGNKRTVVDFLYCGNECVQNDLNCSSRIDSKCHREQEAIKNSLDHLIAIGVLYYQGGFYKLAF